jgi:hypothetical protein
MFFRNLANQGVYLYALDGSGNPKPGDAANITATISKDGNLTAVATATAHPSPVANQPGVYWLPLSQAETDANAFSVYPVSSTGGVTLDPVIAYTDGGPLSDPLARNLLASTSSSGYVPGTGGGVLRKELLLVTRAAVVTPTSATSFTSVGAEGYTLSSVTGFYINAADPLQVCFTTGNLAGLKAPITSYDGTTKAFGFTNGFPFAPSPGDLFDII